MFQMLRDSDTPGSDCKNDMECAKKNLQRALALDDAYMPALNQLALYYFQLAKKRAGEAKASRRGRHMSTNAAIAKRADVQQLELAALVCSQAVRKNTAYAPIHNTAGLIQNELGQVNGAVTEFGQASKLDPKFFEAQMNYAAVNLSFRGFEQAQNAYKKALEMRPNDYDGHLGLALALRGQINDSNYDAQVAAVQGELDTCKKLDASRPDVFYNEGILTQEYKAKSGGDKDKTIASLTQAKGIFQSFVDKAQGKDEYNGAVKKATERMKDIDDTIAFLQLPGANPTPPPAATPAPADRCGPAPAAGATPAPAPGAAPAAASSRGRRAAAPRTGSRNAGSRSRRDTGERRVAPSGLEPEKAPALRKSARGAAELLRDAGIVQSEQRVKRLDSRSMTFDGAIWVGYTHTVIRTENSEESARHDASNKLGAAL